MNFNTAGLSNVVTFIDEVVIYSSSWREHIQHLPALFQKHQQAILVVNLLY